MPPTDRDFIDAIHALETDAESAGEHTIANILQRINQAFQATRELDIEALLDKWLYEHAAGHDLGAWVDIATPSTNQPDSPHQDKELGPWITGIIHELPHRTNHQTFLDNIATAALSAHPQDYHALRHYLRTLRARYPTYHDPDFEVTTAPLT